MHLADGILEPQVIAFGFSATACLFYLVKEKRVTIIPKIPKISIITAALFIASLIHIPVGLTTVHFSFVGLAGILLGPLSFLAVVISLVMHLFLFSHGGFSTLGMNILNFSLAALGSYYLFSIRKKYN